MSRAPGEKLIMSRAPGAKLISFGSCATLAFVIPWDNNDKAMAVRIDGAEMLCRMANREEKQ